MSRPIRSTRAANKRALINANDEESTENQPAEKSVKREAESVSLSEELQAVLQKVVKMENDREGAIRIAGVTQARVEFLEKLIDKKLDTGDVEKKQLNELQKKANALSKQLEKERSEASEDRERLVARVNALTKQLKQERSQFNEDREKLLARIDELERNQAQNKGGQKLTSKTVIKSAASTSASTFARIGGTDHSTNIFDVHYSKGPDSIPIRDALESLKNCEREAMRSHGGYTDSWEWKCMEVYNGEKLHCTLCNWTQEDGDIIGHVHTHMHKEKVVKGEASFGTAYMSRIAFEYWMNKLESIKKKPTGHDNGSSSNKGRR